MKRTSRHGMKIADKQRCICSRPRTSGRVYLGFHACLYCGLLISVVRHPVKPFRNPSNRIGDLFK